MIGASSAPMQYAMFRGRDQAASEMRISTCKPAAPTMFTRVSRPNSIQTQRSRANRGSEDQANSHRQQTVWELPDASRVPVAKHPRFGRYFWALFETVAG